MKREILYREPAKCIAAWNANADVRRKSASGGIAHALAETCMSRGGAFAGTRYDQSLKPIVAIARDKRELEAYKGSKYVQSVMGAEVLKEIEHILKTGQQVTFVGTPCQIAALYATLEQDYQNLLTVDLLCHGTCPTSYFTEELEHLRKEYRIEFDDVRFRDNEGHAFHLTLWNKGQLVKDIPGYCEYYYAGFLYGISMREICYSCKFARRERIADITLGDFIGLGSLSPFEHDKTNVSAVLLNTEKGLKAWNELLEHNPEIKWEERSYEERLTYQYSVLKPFPKDPRREKFLKLYPKYGFVRSIRKVLWPKLWRSCFWQFFRDLKSKRTK